jgi:hypothetical protein
MAIIRSAEKPSDVAMTISSTHQSELDMLQAIPLAIPVLRDIGEPLVVRAELDHL